MLPQELRTELYLVQVLAVIPRRVFGFGVLVLGFFAFCDIVILLGFDLVPFTLDDL